MKNRFFIKIVFFFSLAIFTGCELDDRIDDLTGGYEGKFIDKNTGETVNTEISSGAKLRFLDLGFGDIAQPLDYLAMPDGTFNNSKIFPATYKVWADGPFLELDTIQSMDLSSVKNFDIKVVPNVSLKIDEIKKIFGLGLEITYTYKVNDPLSAEQQIGFIYSELEYPGFNKSALPGENATALATRIVNDVTDLEGTITDLVYLEPNKTYYVRALGNLVVNNAPTAYWNYSDQLQFKTTDFAVEVDVVIDVASVSFDIEVGAISSSSAVLNVTVPEIESLSDVQKGFLIERDNLKYKVEYTDKDGNNIIDLLSGLDYAYVTNIPENTTTNVMVSLSKDGVDGNPTTVAITTDANTDHYIELDATRLANVPFYYDTDFKYSLSKRIAEEFGPANDIGWITNASRHIFLDWWSTWLPRPDLVPSSEYLANITEFTLYGNIKNIVDILPFTNLQTLTIEVGNDLFSTGATVTKGSLFALENINLEPLAKLPNLTTVILGAGVPLTEADFTAAGITGVTIVKN